MYYSEKSFTVKNGVTVTVRTPDKSEAEEVLSFIVKACGQSPYLLSTPDDFWIDARREAEWIEANTKSKNYFLAVYLDGVIIGDCNINFFTHKKDKHRAEVGIAIDKAYWDLGIGSLLFDELIALARATEGIEQIELGVVSTNERARHLYMKKGFTTTGVIPRALKNPDGTYSDEERMTLFL